MESVVKHGTSNGRLKVPWVVMLAALVGNLSGDMVDAKPVQSEEKLTLAGKLVQVAAIGGETTGWALQLDVARNIEDSNIHSIELDPAPYGLRLNALEGKQVEVSGVVQWREGVERKRYPVLVVETIRERSNSPQASFAPRTLNLTAKKEIR